MREGPQSQISLQFSVWEITDATPGSVDSLFPSHQSLLTSLYLRKIPHPIRTCTVLIPGFPGFGEVIPAFEICMNRTSALQLCFSPKICIPSAPLVVKLICDMLSGTFTFVNSVPPSISKYGFTFFGCDNIHLNANGFTPPPYAVLVFCVIAHAGTTSNAYSNCPFKNPGPCGLVKISPYRKPKFHTPVSDVLPLIPCPPPVQISHSRLEFSGEPCARKSPAPIIPANKTSTPANTIFLFTGSLRATRILHNIRKPSTLTIHDSKAPVTGQIPITATPLALDSLCHAQWRPSRRVLAVGWRLTRRGRRARLRAKADPQTEIQV